MLFRFESGPGTIKTGTHLWVLFLCLKFEIRKVFKAWMSNLLTQPQKSPLSGAFCFTLFQILTITDVHRYFETETHVWIFWFSPHDNHLLVISLTYDSNSTLRFKKDIRGFACLDSGFCFMSLPRACWSFRTNTAGGYFFIQQDGNDAM